MLKFHQAEGGSPGAVEMNFLYELGISDFVNNVAQLLRSPDSHSLRKGIAFGYVDDLYWATHFTNMIEIIRFVQERGPEYGYRLNLGKCLYL